MGIATKIGGSNFAPLLRSGIMGLGLDGLSTVPMPAGDLRSAGTTLFSRLVKSQQLPEDVLSIRLEKGKASQGRVTQEGGGMYTFGGIEDDHIVGSRYGLSWASVTSANYW